MKLLGLRCSRLALALAICFSYGGCFLRDSWLHKQMPFYTDPHVMGITTSWERIDELNKLIKEEPKKTSIEREAISEELAKEIQTAKDPLVRMYILKTLAVYPTEMSGRVLAAGMSDPEASVRIVCCKAWGTRGGHEAVEPLSQALKNDSNFDVRMAAARGLGKLKDPAAAGPLAAALNENDPAMQRRLVESLKTVSGRDYANDINAWRQYAESGAAAAEPVAARPWWRPFF